LTTLPWVWRKFAAIWQAKTALIRRKELLKLRPKFIAALSAISLAVISSHSQAQTPSLEDYVSDVRVQALDGAGRLPAAEAFMSTATAECRSLQCA
jgi:hypothetical protein